YDLVRLQVAAERELACGAERAADGASRLRGDAKGRAVRVAHDHRLDRVPAVELEQGLGREPVIGLGDCDRTQRGGAKLSRERFAQGLRQVFHGPEIRHPASQPGPYLLAPV